MSGYARSEKINRHILARSGPVLSPSVKDVYYKYLLSNTIQYIRDSAKIDSLAHSYGVHDYKSLLKVAGLRSSGKISTAKLSDGDAMPDVYAIDTSDSLYAIRDFGNDIVYINFWATWCGPCIQNMPALNTLISEYAANDNVKFINICLDSDREKWETMLKKTRLQGTNLFAEGTWNDKIRALFNIRGIPHYVLVSKGNVVRENGTDKAPHVKDKIEELLSVTQ